MENEPNGAFPYLLLANVVHNNCCGWHDDANKVKRMDR